MAILLAFIALVLGGVSLVRIETLSRRIRELEALLARVGAARPLEPRAPQPPAPVAPTPPVAAPPRPAAPAVPAAAAQPVIRQPEPAPAPAPAAPHLTAPSPTPPRRLDFETLFGQRIAIWAGGATLAIAGLFMVKYAIDIGLLSPPVRVALGALFGLALIAMAEVARSQADRVRDPRVAQALCGAGIATLYGTVVMAAELFHILPPAAAFGAAVLVTAGALGASTRFGPPSALLGLIGGFAAPLLARAGPDNTPLLILYLTLTIAGLGAVAWRQRWTWLTIATLVVGFGWSLILAVGAVGTDPVASICMALMLILLGIGLPVLSAGADPMRRPLQIAGGLVAVVQAAILLSLSGYSMVSWGVYGLISAALVWLAWRDERLRLLPPLAMAVGVVSLLLWSDATVSGLLTVLIGLVAVFGVPAALQLWRGGGVPAALQLAGLLLALWVLPIVHLSDTLSGHGSALLALILAVVAAGLAGLGVRSPARRMDSRFALLVCTTALLVLIAVVAGLPWPWLPTGVALIATGLIVTRGLSGDTRLTVPAGFALGLTALNLVSPAADVASQAFDGIGVLGAVAVSMTGRPVFTGMLPSALAAVSWLALPAAILLAGIVAVRPRLPLRFTQAVRLAAGFMAVAAVFVWIKQAFGIADADAFVARGLLERVVIDQAFFVAGLALMASGRRLGGWIFAGVGLARVVFYSVLLFNPAFEPQHVGGFPLFNLLAPAYLLPAAWIAWFSRKRDLDAPWPNLIAVAQAVLIYLWAVFSVRQLFHGSLLTDGDIGSGESIAYSLVSLIVAAGFLVWGLRGRRRAWRIMSLGLMILAVVKVFAFDAAGLEGLLRIISFIALGFSLIGIGWAYGRFLREGPPKP